MKSFRSLLSNCGRDKVNAAQIAAKSEIMTGYMSEEMHRKLRNLNKKRRQFH